MNYRTTLLLLVLLAAGGASWLYLNNRSAPTTSSATLDFLANDVKADKLTRIEAIRDGKSLYVLEKNGAEWSLPGKWPVREVEVKQLVSTLADLHSRYAPLAIDKNADLSKFGLDKGTLVVKLDVGGKQKTLHLGEEPADKNRFTRPTFLNLDGEKEVIRLGPGVIANLERSQEYFQQRRLFQAERVAKDDESQDKVEQVVAKEIQIKGPNTEFTITKKDKDWVVTAPVSDRIDPDKIRGVLTKFVDLWAERFVSKDKKLEETGLEKPEYTLKVIRPSGDAITVLVGKISDTKERVVTKPSPQASPFGPPPKPNIEFIKEEYRYAKLPDNPQIFEIKSDALKEIAPALAELRDPRIARFKTDDVRRIEIEQAGKSIVLAKEGDKWKVEKPTAFAAEKQPITELLDKLSGLEAKGADVRDKADPKSVGLDKETGKITLVLEEAKKVDGKEVKSPRTLVFHLGTNQKDAGKLFVQVAGSARVNAVADDLLKLAEREPLVYRERRALDVASSDVRKIQITRGKDEFTFERKDDAWHQTQPLAAKLETNKVNMLVSDLGRLETSEFIKADPKGDELDKTYGLASPAVKATLTFKDEKKPPVTLVVGKQRPFKDDYFARLDQGPVMLVKKDLFESLDRGPLVYRPTQAWQVAEDKIIELKVTKDGQPFSLVKQDKAWKIFGPFTAPARPEYLQLITEELAQLKSEKFVAQGAKDLAKFGLDKPYLVVEVVTREAVKDEKSKDDKKTDLKEKAKETTTTSVLHIGKMADKGGDRYARLADGDAIFIITEKALTALDRGPLDLLDRTLITLNASEIHQVDVKRDAPFKLEKDKAEWQVTGSPAPKFTAQEPAVQSFLDPWNRLLAERIAAYGDKIDWAQYGLDKPSATVTVHLGGKVKKTHTIALGKDAGKNQRYARVDQQSALAVLEGDTLKNLDRGYLDFVNPRVLKFPFDAVTKIERQMKNGDIELIKKDDAWRIAKPSQLADSLTVDDIVEKTFQLKALRVAAFPAKDIKPFGLDAPVATVTIHLGDDKSHVLKIGALAGKDDERYAQVDSGQTVVVLSGELSRHLTAPVQYFADRNLASFGAADRIEMERGPRKVVFVKDGASWKVADPVKGDAEPNLSEFLQGLFRLRADEIVAGKEADLKEFGLDRPEAQWRFFQGDKEVLHLQLGGLEKGKKDAARRYGKLGKGDSIFLLNPKTTAMATAEYRNRKPWASLDAAQVDKIAVVGPGAMVTLQKTGGNWTIQSQPESKVSAKAVTDLLDALAGLKVERYIADVKGDLQLHGLKPPVWRIEAHTASGSKVLLLGRAEGDSGRLYGAVEGSDAVFVISDTDARRLTRPLAAFMEEKGS